MRVRLLALNLVRLLALMRVHWPALMPVPMPVRCLSALLRMVDWWRLVRRKLLRRALQPSQWCRDTSASCSQFLHCIYLLMRTAPCDPHRDLQSANGVAS